MNIRQLPKPELFLASAIANLELAQWIPWQHGICVGYHNETSGQDGVLCLHNQGGVGFFASIVGLKAIASVESVLYILCQDGFLEWAGQDSYVKLDCPMVDWHHVQIASWGGVGFFNFRFHCWNKTTGEVKTLPIGVEKIWGLGLQNEILWSYWGQFFLRGETLIALEEMPDTMEHWTAMTEGWWVAEYDHRLVFWHPRFSLREIELVDILSVHVRSNRSEVLLLNVDGRLDCLNVRGFQKTLLIEEDADTILGDYALLADDALFDISG